jgi:hypothetical protein
MTQTPTEQPAQESKPLSPAETMLIEYKKGLEQIEAAIRKVSEDLNRLQQQRLMQLGAIEGVQNLVNNEAKKAEPAPEPTAADNVEKFPKRD